MIKILCKRNAIVTSTRNSKSAAAGLKSKSNSQITIITNRNQNNFVIDKDLPHIPEISGHELGTRSMSTSDIELVMRRMSKNGNNKNGNDINKTKTKTKNKNKNTISSNKDATPQLIDNLSQSTSTWNPHLSPTMSPERNANKPIAKQKDEDIEKEKEKETSKVLRLDKQQRSQSQSQRSQQSQSQQSQPSQQSQSSKSGTITETDTIDTNTNTNTNINANTNANANANAKQKQSLMRMTIGNASQSDQAAIILAQANAETKFRLQNDYNFEAGLGQMGKLASVAFNVIEHDHETGGVHSVNNNVNNNVNHNNNNNNNNSNNNNFYHIIGNPSNDVNYKMSANSNSSLNFAFLMNNYGNGDRDRDRESDVGSHHEYSAEFSSRSAHTPYPTGRTPSETPATVASASGWDTDSVGTANLDNDIRFSELYNEHPHIVDIASDSNSFHAHGHGHGHGHSHVHGRTHHMNHLNNIHGANSNHYMHGNVNINEITQSNTQANANVNINGNIKTTTTARTITTTEGKKNPHQKCMEKEIAKDRDYTNYTRKVSKVILVTPQTPLHQKPKQMKQGKQGKQTKHKEKQHKQQEKEKEKEKGKGKDKSKQKKKKPKATKEDNDLVRSHYKYARKRDIEEILHEKHGHLIGKRDEIYQNARDKGINNDSNDKDRLNCIGQVAEHCFSTIEPPDEYTAKTDRRHFREVAALATKLWKDHYPNDKIPATLIISCWFHDIERFIPETKCKYLPEVRLYNYLEYFVD